VLSSVSPGSGANSRGGSRGPADQQGRLERQRSLALLAHQAPQAAVSHRVGEPRIDLQIRYEQERDFTVMTAAVADVGKLLSA
jgi:hypothetical protein